jgi:SAM-dependent methyltransferase
MREVVTGKLAPYGRSFFEGHREGSGRSADTIVPLLIEAVEPSSVADIGCGQGLWLSAFRSRGVTDVFGVDGEWVDARSLEIPRACFETADLAKPLSLNRRFDLVMSLEVAEHLPVASAGTFVQSLVGLGPVVFFSAAIPFQGGVSHVNEQWPDYWAGLFERHGYVAVDYVRPIVWNNPDVVWWYAQNAMIFVREDILSRYTRLAEAAKVRDRRLSLVHPRRYLAAVEDSRVDPDRLGLSTLLWALPRATLNAVKRRVLPQKR